MWAWDTGDRKQKGHWLYQSQIAHRNGVDSAEGCEQKNGCIRRRIDVVSTTNSFLVMKARMEDKGRGKVEATTSSARKMHQKAAVDISVAITGPGHEHHWAKGGHHWARAPYPMSPFQEH